MATPNPVASVLPGTDIPDKLIEPSYPDDPHKGKVQAAREVSRNLKFLKTAKYNGYAPYVWGFTVYRAVFGPGSDERVAAGIARMEAWIRFCIRQTRFDEDSDFMLWMDYPELRPVEGAPDPTDDMAARMWMEVIEDYPDRDQVRAGDGIEPGDEDFRPIGRAFLAWVKSTGMDVSERQDPERLARYDHCLVIDERSLQSIESLAAEAPEVRPEDPTVPKRQFQPIDRAWVWILDRETIERHLAGDTKPRLRPATVIGYTLDYVPPWLRLEIGCLYDHWFHHSRHMQTPNWDTKCRQDDVDYDRVFWYHPSAYNFNEASQRARREGRPGPRLNWRDE